MRPVALPSPRETQLGAIQIDWLQKPLQASTPRKTKIMAVVSRLKDHTRLTNGCPLLDVDSTYGSHVARIVLGGRHFSNILEKDGAFYPGIKDSLERLTLHIAC